MEFAIVGALILVGTFYANWIAGIVLSVFYLLLAVLRCKDLI